MVTTIIQEPERLTQGDRPELEASLGYRMKKVERQQGEGKDWWCGSAHSTCSIWCFERETAPKSSYVCMLGQQQMELFWKDEEALLEEVCHWRVSFET